jgi:hypothetical protein
MTDWSDPDQRESALAAKWAEAEDRIKALIAEIAELREQLQVADHIRAGVEAERDAAACSRSMT